MLIAEPRDGILPFVYFSRELAGAVKMLKARYLSDKLYFKFLQLQNIYILMAGQKSPFFGTFNLTK